MFAKQILSIFVTLSFVFNYIFVQLIPANSAWANETISLAQQNIQAKQASLIGFHVSKDNPLEIDFIVSKPSLNKTNVDYRFSIQKSINYFFAALTIPETDLWVNLSPYEKDRVIPQNLSQTELGQTLLEQDNLLKHSASSLLDPSTELGKQYWEDTNNTSTNCKIWLTPGYPKVYIRDDSVMLLDSDLKVLSNAKYTNNEENVIDRIVVPEIQDQIENNEKFAPFREASSAVILATTYKKIIKNHIINKYYKDQDKVGGIALESTQYIDNVTEQYLKSVTSGVINCIEKVKLPETNRLVKKHYFSGGYSTFYDGQNLDERIDITDKFSSAVLNEEDDTLRVKVRLDLKRKAKDDEQATNVFLSFFNNIRDKSKVDNPLSITTLAGALRHDFEDQVNVAMAHHINDGGYLEIIEKLKTEKPDILGLSIGFGGLEETEHIMQYVYSLPKEERPIVVMGNIVAAYNVDYILEKYPEALVCVGLGEEMLKSVVRFYNGEIEIDEVPDMAYKVDGEIVHTKRSMKTLAAGLPDNSFMPSVVNSGGVIYMETSRGCPYNCAICDRKTFQAGGWRGRDIDEIIEDIVEASNLGVRNINFVDEDLFAGGVERVLELARKIKKAKLEGRISNKLMFGSSASVRQIFRKNSSDEKNAERLTAFQELYDAGLRVLFIGIESGAPDQLKRYSKAAVVEENVRAIELIEAMGIYVIPGFIMLDPLVNKDEIRMNIDFLRKTKMDARITYPLKTYIPLRRSAYTEKLMEMGLVDKDQYVPDRLAYEFYFKNDDIAQILGMVKDWEDSQAMFFWELKILFRSAKFGAVSEKEQKFLRAMIDKQTRILIDYLDSLVKLNEEELEIEVVDKYIAKRFGRRLINDFIEILNKVDAGEFTLADQEFMNVVYKGLIREVLRVDLFNKEFSLDKIISHISKKYFYNLDHDRAQAVLSKFISEQRVVKTQGDAMILGENFHKLFDIPWPDMPRMSIKSKQLLLEEKENVLPTTGGADYRNIELDYVVQRDRAGRIREIMDYKNLDHDLFLMSDFLPVIESFETLVSLS